MTGPNVFTIDPRLNQVSAQDAADMYDLCKFSNLPVSLKRIWPGNECPDIIALCPGNDAFFAGQTYTFILTNNKEITMTCPDSTALDNLCTVAGDGLLSEIGHNCLKDEDCVTNHGHFDMFDPPDIAGICTCNPSTDEGCTGADICASSDEIGLAGREFDGPPECFLPFGAPEPMTASV